MGGKYLFSLGFAVEEYWIGFTDAESECYWTWMGSDVIALYEAWLRFEPGTDFTSNCAAVLLQHDFYWIDVPCSNQYRAICER